jgi:hypothetical protein
MKAYALMVLVGCSWRGVEGSGKATSEARTVPGFTAVDIDGVIDADLAIGSEPRVEISGDDNLVPLITTEVTGNRLEIGTRKNIRTSLPLRARVTAPRINEVGVSGSNDVAIHGVHDDSLKLGLSGSASIRGEGAVRQLGVELSGSGNLKLAQLTAERAHVTITGSGNVELTVSQALEVHITGSGTVTYRGDPAEVKRDITGSGRLVKR